MTTGERKLSSKYCNGFVHEGFIQAEWGKNRGLKCIAS